MIKGLNDGGKVVNIKTIKSKVSAFRDSMRVKTALKKNASVKKMVKQLDKYWDELFADPIEVTTSQGERLTIQPQRTNNILERFFRDLKRMYRSKNEKISLSRTMKAMIADTPFMKNLSNPDYLKTILSGYDTLKERFAEIDASIVRAELKSQIKVQKIMSSKMKKLLRTPSMPIQITGILKKAS